LMPEADVVVTDDPSIAVAIQTADCVPLLFVDRRTRAVGAAHAGWRGLAAGVPRVAVARMCDAFGCRVEDVLVAAGPSIGACCYEVGEDVRARFADAGFGASRIAGWFHTQPLEITGNPPMSSLPKARRATHWFFDGWSCVREQLTATGILPGHIFTADLCTASHEGVGCSYRRDGAVAGRMAAVIRSENSEVRTRKF